MTNLIVECNYYRIIVALTLGQIFFSYSDTIANNTGDRVENDSKTDVKSSNSPLYLDNSPSQNVSESWQSVSNIHPNRTYLLQSEKKILYFGTKKKT